MNIEQAKGICLPEILRKLGYLPVKQQNDELLFFSPFRSERAPSFKVSESKNIWYDFGLPGGGDIIKFATTYLQFHDEDYTVLRNMTGTIDFATTFKLTSKFEEERTATLTMRGTTQISNKNLIEYIKSRGISLELAQKYVEEGMIHNSKSGNDFYALCWKNENDGYEVRNPFFKGCVSSKAITFIRCTDAPAAEVHLFEGMFDFLSVVEEKKSRFKGDVIVLNSVACVPQAIAYVKSYPYTKLSTWFDNDTGGTLATKTLQEFAEKTGTIRFQGQNKKYHGFEDVNAWRMRRAVLASTPK